MAARMFLEKNTQNLPYSNSFACLLSIKFTFIMHHSRNVHGVAQPILLTTSQEDTIGLDFYNNDIPLN